MSISVHIHNHSGDKKYHALQIRYLLDLRKSALYQRLKNRIPNTYETTVSYEKAMIGKTISKDDILPD